MQKNNKKLRKAGKSKGGARSELQRWAMPLIALAAFGIAVLAASAQFDPVGTRSAEDVVSFDGEGEVAPYVIDGETVYVNNGLCAVSHSRLDPQNLNEFTSRVRYDGPLEAFRGKTLVFNQCCEMCIKKFPDMWEENSDKILKYHGVLPQRQNEESPKE